MKAYLVTTASVFALVALAHAARVAVEPHALGAPMFVVSSLLAVGLCAWGLVLVRGSGALR